MKNLYDEIKMFSYWAEDKGLERALEEYSPAILKAYPEIKQMLRTIQVTKLGIKAFIEKEAQKLGFEEDC